MGSHSSAKPKLRKGLWSPEEDEKLVRYITKYGHKCWSIVPKQAGLQRCGKSCRLRWINYLRPDLKRGHFTEQEEELIIKLHAMLGNRWAQIATQLPGRTDNEIKNFWNSCLRKKLRQVGIDPQTHKPIQLGLGGIVDDPGEVIEFPIRNQDQSSNFRFCQPQHQQQQQQQCGSDQVQDITLSMLPITLSPSSGGQQPHPYSRSIGMNFFPVTTEWNRHHQAHPQPNCAQLQPIDDEETAFSPETSSAFPFWIDNSSSNNSSNNSSSSNNATTTNSSGGGGSPSSCSESESWSCCFQDGIFSPTGTGSSVLCSWGLLDSSMLETKIDLASWQQQQQPHQSSSQSLAQFYDDEPTESDPISDVLDQM